MSSGKNLCIEDLKELNACQVQKTMTVFKRLFMREVSQSELFLKVQVKFLSIGYSLRT